MVRPNRNGSVWQGFGAAPDHHFFGLSVVFANGVLNEDYVKLHFGSVPRESPRKEYQISDVPRRGVSGQFGMDSALLWIIIFS